MRVNWYVWSRVFFVSLSGFILGYELGSMNGVTDMIGYRQALNLSYRSFGGNETQESCDAQDDVETSAILGLIVSLLSVGCLVGSPVAGVLSDTVGRKPTVIVGAILVACSGILHLAAVNLWMVLLSRIIGGAGVGILQVSPLYVAEISPEELRGKSLSFYNVFVLSANIIGIIVDLIVKNFLFGWRIAVGIQFPLGLILALGMLLIPRSPRWLARRNRDEEALKILCKVYKDEERAQARLRDIKSTSVGKASLGQTLKHVLEWKNLQRLLLGFFQFVIGRFTGINFIQYFSVIVFCGIGLPGFVVSIALPVAALISVLSMSFIVDKLGRKPIFLIGTIAALVSHVTSASLILAFNLDNEEMEFSVSQQVASYFVLVTVCTFFGSAAASYGNLTWMVVNEMFPLQNRGLMVAISTSGFWVGLISSSQVSPVLISSPLKISGTLYLFAAITFLLFLYILLLLPETKGVPLEKIDELFSKPWLERTNVLYYLRCGCFKELKIRTRRNIYQLLPVPESQDKSPTDVDGAPSSNNDVLLLEDQHEATGDLEK